MTFRILVAEDEAMVAFDLCDTVEEAGYEVEGPHGDASSAIAASQKARPDVAILDISLDDGNSFALAEELDAANVPIIFHSGVLTTGEVEERFPGAITLTKPCPPTTMIEALHSAVQGPRKPD
ncbi:MAG: response regulator [Erythrobacter sp.]|jgi:DNA-binding NarL/FixJ family response regulator|nr:response regulator [Erythrobacter sp.]